MGNVISFKEERCFKVLVELYNAQMCSFFPDDAMPRVMDKLGFSEDEMIQYVRYFLEKKYLRVSAYKPSYFLRPGYIQNFPVTLTSSALTWIKSK